MKIKAILLAAGNSTRFLGNKLLSEWQGKPLSQYVMDTLEKCDIPCVVVTQYDEIVSMAKHHAFECIINPNPEQGISSSIRLGLSLCKGYDGVIFLVADQPYISCDTIYKMCIMADRKHIVCCASDNREGNPVLFPSCYFDELADLKGDRGGKQLIEKYSNRVKKLIVLEKELWDIDTVEDMKRGV